MTSYPIEEALKAQRAMRAAAGLGEETFPIQAFVGMISDEIQVLRQQGRSDREIAQIIRDNSSIDLTADDISANYASPAERQHRP